MEFVRVLIVLWCLDFGQKVFSSRNFLKFCFAVSVGCNLLNQRMACFCAVQDKGCACQLFGCVILIHLNDGEVAGWGYFFFGVVVDYCNGCRCTSFLFDINNIRCDIVAFNLVACLGNRILINCSGKAAPTSSRPLLSCLEQPRISRC